MVNPLLALTPEIVEQRRYQALFTSMPNGITPQKKAELLAVKVRDALKEIAQMQVSEKEQQKEKRVLALVLARVLKNEAAAQKRLEMLLEEYNDLMETLEEGLQRKPKKKLEEQPTSVYPTTVDPEDVYNNYQIAQPADGSIVHRLQIRFERFVREFNLIGQVALQIRDNIFKLSGSADRDVKSKLTHFLGGLLADRTLAVIPTPKPVPGGRSKKDEEEERTAYRTPVPKPKNAI